MSDLKQRFITSSIWVVLVIALVYLSPYSYFALLFTACLSGVLAVALWEFYRMASIKGFHPPVKTCITLSVIYTFVTFFSLLSLRWSFVPSLVFGICIFACFVSYFKNFTQPIANISIAVLGLIYITIPVTLILRINYFQTSREFDGRWWLLYLLVVTKSTDIGAYFSGKLFGKHKLAPTISPGKTVEGFIVGVCSSTVASFVLYFVEKSYFSTLILNWYEALILGVLLGVLGQIGDLSESLFKRDSGVKDSNNYRGVGGVLDLLDSLLFTTPIIYIFLWIKEVV